MWEDREDEIPEIHVSYVSLLVSSMKSQIGLNIFKLSSTLKCLKPFRKKIKGDIL